MAMANRRNGLRVDLFAFVCAKPREPRRPSQAIARQIAVRALREAFRHGLLASDLKKALDEISGPRRQE